MKELRLGHQHGTEYLEPSHIKEEEENPNEEEQEELWTNQEGEQFQGLEEAGMKFSFTPVKIKDDEEEVQSSQLHQRQTEKMETEADGVDYGGPEPDRKLDPESDPRPETDETDVSDDWEETREPQSDDLEVYLDLGLWRTRTSQEVLVLHNHLHQLLFPYVQFVFDEPERTELPLQLHSSQE
ncbi:hypothetical protein EYF80_055939 [Liparis tanakae]|uniref:Uncharacterized protein n=1 Tax=Liparis tanakae TaxID=230148 RepID=A0A4Z2EYG0_9TELE|nr:hypothetical protein EYF80_055939 [Liparis tanakae]